MCAGLGRLERVVAHIAVTTRCVSPRSGSTIDLKPFRFSGSSGAVARSQLHGAHLGARMTHSAQRGETEQQNWEELTGKLVLHVSAMQTATSTNAKTWTSTGQCRNETIMKRKSISLSKGLTETQIVEFWQKRN